ncbi:MAG: methylmalonyl Co-A mutase-associated GTPase MeaB [Acidobacteria bacterium]|nr:methylmalonyl Co-A mutase-associated GTPase MeaB [Acidobacteriota bacterium]
MDISDEVEAASAGSRRAIGRLLTRVERGERDLEALIHPRNQAQIIGLTGAPGVGKSTITGHLAARLARRGRVAVMAIDPSSPVSGGAILGDRIRMDSVLGEADVFIRSMATRGSEGGLSAAAPAAFRLLDAIGFDVIIVETVGVGQVEVDIAAAADTTVVVVTPGWGDAIQANKAGLLEVADVFVINKADRPGASDTRRDLELMLDLTATNDHSWRAPIVATIGTSAEGIEELIGAIDEHDTALEAQDLRGQRRRARTLLEVRSRVGLVVESRLDAALETEQISARIDSVAADGGDTLALVDALTELLFGFSDP